MQRKWWCDAMRTCNQEYALCDEVEDLKDIKKEKVIALKGCDQPLQINKLTWLTGVDAAKQRGERIWKNDAGFWSATPFGKFVD